MRILITGATGFIGRYLTLALSKIKSYEICILVRDINKTREIFSDIDIQVIDCNDVTLWREKIINFNADIVFHFAGLFTTSCDVVTAKSCVESNVLFTTYLLEATSNTSCRLFVNAGSFSEYNKGDDKLIPSSLYAATKTAARSIIQYYQTLADFRWINLVIYSVYGRYNTKKKIVDYLIDAINAEMAVDFTEGNQILDSIHIDDVICCCILLINNYVQLSMYEQLYLGTGQGYSIKELASIVEKVWGGKLNANWGALPYRHSTPMVAIAPINKNNSIVGWVPKIDFEEGLRIYKNNIMVNS